MEDMDISKQFDDENIYDHPPVDKLYRCSYCNVSTGFTLLMKYICHC